MQCCTLLEKLRGDFRRRPTQAARSLTSFTPFIYKKTRTVIHTSIVIKSPDKVRDVRREAHGCTQEWDKKHPVIVNGPYGRRALSATLTPMVVVVGVVTRKAAQKVELLLAVLFNGNLHGTVYDAPLA